VTIRATADSTTKGRVIQPSVCGAEVITGAVCTRSPAATIVEMRNALLTAVLLLLLAPEPAWAYIDPGAGSYFFQLLIAGGLAGVYTLRRHWQQVRIWFSRRKGQ
jgi:hypothetical protein